MSAAGKSSPIKKSVRYILDGLSMPVFVVDPKENLRFINKAASKRYSSAKEGKAFAKVINEEECLKAMRKILKGAPNGTAMVTLQEVVPTNFRVSLSRLDAEKSQNDPSCVLCFEDISHIQEAEQMRHDFVANVSHELRSPLTALTGFIETLQGPASDDANARHRFLEMMAKESNRMARLVADLLSLSKLQASERMAPEQTTDLFNVLNRVFSSLGGLADKGGIKIVLDLKGEMPLVIGDSDELTQVFQNLVENAIKYSPEGSEVHVSLCDPKKSKKKKRKHLCICVVDSGDGIDPIHIPRLTERFYRVDKGRSRMKGGTGLGLAIVKHILIRHRGWLTIDSEPGKGSRFSVYLPIARQK